jgi:hypothetical protein
MHEIRNGSENEAYTDISRGDATAGRIFGD